MPRQRQLSFCRDQVRRLDPDRYLTALFLPRTPREHVFALYAFNSEIARAREVVSEPALAAIRLRWWHEAIAEVYSGGKPRAHPIVEALDVAVRNLPLSRRHFEQLIGAREADLEPRTLANMAALEQYAEQTAAPLISLVVEALGTPDELVPEAPQEAARAVGTAWALTGLLRAVPYHARTELLYLPQDLLDESQVSRYDLFELRTSPGLAAVVRTVAERAHTQLATARANLSDVPRRIRPGLLTATAASAYLTALRRADYNVFALPRTLPSLAPKLARVRLLGRY